MTDIDILIGAGDLLLARSALEQCTAATPRDFPNPSFFRTLAHLYVAEGRRDAAIAVMERFIVLGQKWLARTGLQEQFGASPLASDVTSDLELLRAGGELPEGTLNRLHPKPIDQRVPEGALFRALPRPPRGNVRFVLVGGAMQYVDRRGEFSCQSGETMRPVKQSSRLAEEASRAISMVESDQWNDAAIKITHRLLEIAQRNGDRAWTYSVGFTTGQFRDLVKAVAARAPRKGQPNSAVLQKPDRGRWLYDRNPSLFMIHCIQGHGLFHVETPPTVALWRWPDRSDPMLQGMCDTFASESEVPITVILPDTPGLRDFARRYVKRYSMDRIDRILLENLLHFGTEVPNQRGDVCYARFAPTLVIEPDTAEWDGDLLAGALDFLDANYQVRISPWELVKDPLLRAQLPARIKAIKAERASRKAWTTEEKGKLEKMRNWYQMQWTFNSQESAALYRKHWPAPLTQL